MNAYPRLRGDTNFAHHAQLRNNAGPRRDFASDHKGMTPRLAPQPGETAVEGLRRKSFSTFRPSAQLAAPANKDLRMRWSADFSGGSTVAVVRKNQARPVPPLRSISLPLRAPSPSYPPSKRHSCPGVPQAPAPVKTSLITGPSPLGCRLRPRTSPRPPQGSRLSLQLPLSISAPGDPPPTPALNGRAPDAPPRPRPGRRCRSDSSALLRHSVGDAPLHVVTLQELGGVRLRRAQPLPDGPDSVFATEGEEEDLEPAPRRRPEAPPQVPPRSAYSTWLAQQVARSFPPDRGLLRDRGLARPELDAVSQGEAMYTRVNKKSQAVGGGLA